MNKTLTITIKDIPDELWEHFWEDQKRLSIEECGTPVVETDTIKIDAMLLIQYYVDTYSDLMSIAGVVHTIDTANTILNQ